MINIFKCSVQGAMIYGIKYRCKGIIFELKSKKS